ncbi:hypothetical protein ACFLS9_00755 [Bacteroidota bacterium]
MFYVARDTFTAAVKEIEKSRGISPDIPVQQSVENIINGKDTVLDYTIGFIDKKL